MCQGCARWDARPPRTVRLVTPLAVLVYNVVKSCSSDNSTMIFILNFSFNINSVYCSIKQYHGILDHYLMNSVFLLSPPRAMFKQLGAVLTHCHPTMNKYILGVLDLWTIPEWFKISKDVNTH